MSRVFTRLGCGLDISKKKIHACFGGIKQDGSYAIKGTRRFDNTPSGIKKFLSWIDTRLSNYNPESILPFQMIMEPTGVYHENLLSASYKADLSVCLVLAQRVKYYLLSVGQISKTDEIDAKGICRMACEVKQKQWKPCSPNIMKLRSALRHRKSLLDSKVRYKNQLHARKHSNWSSPSEEKSICRLIQSIDDEVDLIEKEINKLYKQDKVLRKRLQKIIDSVYGLGMITALTVVAETNGFAQIQSRKQLARYAGYDIIQNQSGQREGHTRISKRGNSRIRAVMHMASLSAVQEEGPFQAMFMRILRKNPKAKMKGYVAVQRKLLLLIYTLYKKDTVFDPQYHKMLEQKIKNGEKGSSHLKSELRGIDADKMALSI